MQQEAQAFQYWRQHTPRRAPLLRTQASAVEVDNGVLAIGQDGSSEELMNRKKQNNVLKTPQAWLKSSSDNLSMAQHLVADSVRWAGAACQRSFFVHALVEGAGSSAAIASLALE